MAEVVDISRQGFAAAKAAFEERDFRLMNILANRLMSNVLFGTGDEKTFALPGLFLKDIAVDFIPLKDGNGVDDRHRIAKAAIAQVERALKSDLDLAVFWATYLKYYNDSRKVDMSAIERRTYKEHPTFTSQAISFLCRELFEGESVFVENSLLAKGTLQEIDRLIRCHGADDREIVLFLLVRVIDWLNDYYRLACTSAQGVVNLDCVKSKLSPFLARVRKWREEQERMPFENASDILCDGILEWRRCFIVYLERGRVSPETERRIELPVETKKRIGDTIAEALQKDVAARRGKGRH
ncbi:MAG TPA: hypothetical protein VFU31_16810 [Candidatus Binatia bacterium]|nr:hypothetical protein [Candidatus Binatia bacterium]